MRSFDPVWPLASTFFIKKQLDIVERTFMFVFTVVFVGMTNALRVLSVCARRVVMRFPFSVVLSP